MPQPVRPEDFTRYSLLSEPSVAPGGDAVAVTAYRANLESNEYEGNVWLVPVKGGKPTKVTDSGKDGVPKFSPDGNRIAFISKRGIKKGSKGNALYIIPVRGGSAKLLLKRKRPIESPAWFPDGKRMLFTSAVGEAQDDVKTIRRVNFWFNEKGFIFNLRRHLFILDVASGKAKQATEGEFDVEKSAVSHSGKKVAYTASTEDLKPYLTDIFVLDLEKRSTTRLTRHDMEISSVAWTPEDDRIVFLGHRRKSGSVTHDHLWVVEAKGGEPRQVENIDRSKSNTLNSDVRKGGLNSDPKCVGRNVLFLVNDEGAAHVYTLNLSGGEPKLVIGGKRSVEAFEACGRKIVFASMEPSKLADLYIYDEKITQLTRFNDDLDKTLDIVEPASFQFNASDGERIDGWVLRPRGKGRFPAILYIHGGPKTAFGYSFLHEFQVFVARGYAVLFINPRGSDSYSEKFADIRGHYAERDYLDLMEAVEYAVSHFDFVDGSKMGVAGGSYGGYMTNWIVTQTNRFKAAVSDRSISNWWTFWGTSDIGTYFTKDQIGCDPWEDEEMIMAKSPIRYVKNVKTPIMFVHSFEDYRCWMVEALQMFTALKYFGKETELVLFPGENHELSRGGKPKHRVARLESYLRWFDAHLKN